MKVFHNLFNSKLLTPADWEKFRSEFEKEYPEFYSKLHMASPDLSPAEVRLVTMMKLKYDTKKVAEVLCINPKSITKSRYRLKKKLGLLKLQSLERWVESI